MENIVLLDTLQQLTTGKEDNCSMCEVDWDQQAASCYSFSKNAKSWHNSLDACTAMSASLVKIDTKKELAFLKNEISKRVYVYRGQQFSFNFWTGLNYDNDIGNWTWADGSPFSFQLGVTDDRDAGQGRLTQGCQSDPLSFMHYGSASRELKAVHTYRRGTSACRAAPNGRFISARSQPSLGGTEKQGRCSRRSGLRASADLPHPGTMWVSRSACSSQLH
ncbi:oxidized low-density lipoprotein receptor 1-like isoform X7 [Lepidochelys kempii]